MSNLTKYVEKVRKYIEEHKDMTELEIIRYVYIDLAKRFSFDLNFAFGNSETRKKIYRQGRTEESQNESMDSNIIICTVSYIFEYVLKQFGINIQTIVDERDYRSCKHLFNKINLKDGRKFIVDLQQDFENIQSGSRTKWFGLSDDLNGKAVIQQFELEQIDKKIGYIDSEHYYSDDYIYTLKSDIGLFENLNEKTRFVLENLEIYENKDMEYVERKSKHEEILKKLFSRKEMNKIHLIDCYYKQGDEKKYMNCISVDSSDGPQIYMYSVEEGRYLSVDAQDFIEKVKNGLVYLQDIPGLKHIIRKTVRDEEEK